MELTFFETTYIGSRISNEDYYTHLVNEKWACFVLADGLGGHEGGEIASALLCQSLIEAAPKFATQIMESAITGMEGLFTQAWHQFKETIYSKYATMDPHTTIVLLWLDENQMVTAHVGDSRIYRLEKNEIIWRTHDHTHVQTLVDQGMITEEEALGHPLQYRLLRSVNANETPEIDISVDRPLIKGETMLLCSDGFWNTLSQAEILQLAKTDNLEKTAKELSENILDKHPLDADNITIQLIR